MNRIRVIWVKVNLGAWWEIFWVLGFGSKSGGQAFRFRVLGQGWASAPFLLRSACEWLGIRSGDMEMMMSGMCGGGGEESVAD